MIKYTVHLLDKILEDTYGEDSAKVKAILSQIKETAFSLVKVEEIKAFVSNHQKLLLERKETEVDPAICDKVLDWLETFFPEYLNENLPISVLGKEKLFLRYREVIIEAKEQTKALSDERLFTSLLPIFEAENDPNLTLKYAKYLDCFWSNWRKFEVSFEKSSYWLDLIEILISNNFNTGEFFKYNARKFREEANQTDDPFLIEEIFYSHLSKLRQIPLVIGMSFDSELDHIKTLLENWLKIEIGKCRLRQKSYNPSQTGIFKEKLKTSLSVAQLAYFFRLLKNTDIIANPVIMDIFHVIINNFSTKQVETITLESLRNKYYNPELRTMESVKDLIRKMIQIIDKEN